MTKLSFFDIKYISRKGEQNSPKERKISNMKIIHCSDLHLDSKMETNLDKEKARERKNEILITFEKMVEYAKKNEVKAIIIAGDLFDKKNITVKAKNIVKNAILNAPEIDFLYLKGNHDESGFIDAEEKSDNLKTFNDKDWTTYKYGNISITGIEFGERTNYEIYNSLLLDKNETNIVVMHGQETVSNIKDKAEVINLKQLKNKNIDYLALGHIHNYKQEKLDNRGIYCYPGCLEGRGFDEVGEKGFVILNIEDQKVQTEFIPFAQRNLYEVEVDITGCIENQEIEGKIEEKIQSIPEKSLVKIVLTGEVDLENNIDVPYLVKKFEERFYFLKIYNKTSVKIDYMKYQYDASLKGEFIRLVLQQEITDEEKSQIINTGIKALSGEEI